MGALRTIANGETIRYEIPSLIIEACRGMSADVKNYIELEDDTVFVDINEVVLSRARPEGLENAVRNMREAAAGQRSKRAPIEFRKIDDHFLVTDGNSTTVVLAALGAAAIPGTIR